MNSSAIIPRCPQEVGDTPPQFGPDKPWLAPLAGYSDLPFRLLCRSYGAATCVTEMVSAAGIYYHGKATGRLLASAEADRPLVVQLFGGEAGILAHAVTELRKAGYNWFDLNLGCSVRKMLRQNAGASLLADPDRILTIAKAMINAARTPCAGNETCGMVGFKLRLGINSQHPVLPDLALRLEDAGASWLCLHPRYAAQGFSGNANWQALADLAPRLQIPLLASGDLFTAEDGIEVMRQTGVNGVMYARGALRNPAIFARHKALYNGLEPPAQDRRHLRRLVDMHISLVHEYGDQPQMLFKMRSILPHYAKYMPGVSEMRKELCSCTSWEELGEILDKHLGTAGERE